MAKQLTPGAVLAIVAFAVVVVAEFTLATMPTAPGAQAPPPITAALPVTQPSSTGTAITAALIALVSALSAVLLTGFQENRRERRRIAAAAAQDDARHAHEERRDQLRRDHEVAQESARLSTENRLHLNEQRLAAYVEFNAAAAEIFARAQVWVDNGGVHGTIVDALAPTLSRFITSYQRSRLLASQEVKQLLNSLQEIVQQLVNNPRLPEVTTTLEGYPTASNALDGAMRQELFVA